MKVRYLLLMTAAMTGMVGSARAGDPDHVVPKGRLVIVGGGGSTDPIRERALELAGGPRDAHVLLVPYASGDPQTAGELMLNAWRTEGVEHIKVLDLTEERAAVESIQDADLIWMRGGSQTRLMEALGPEAITNAFRERYYDGAIIGGTSAGAAVMSRLMIAGYAGQRDTPEGAKARTANGLGLWPEVVVDQHFLRRNRIERLRSVVLEHPALLGIGIDESTGVIVRDREFEVIGQSDVVVLDARKQALEASESSEEAETSSPPVATRAAVRMVTCTLKPGMRYDLDKGILSQEVAVHDPPTK